MLLSIGLAPGRCDREGVQLGSGGIDTKDSSIGREIHAVASRAEDLRHYTDVRQRGSIPEREWPRQLCEARLDGLEAAYDPVL